MVVSFSELASQLGQLCVNLTHSKVSIFSFLPSPGHYGTSPGLCWRWASPVWVSVVTHSTDQGLSQHQFPLCCRKGVGVPSLFPPHAVQLLVPLSAQAESFSS